MAILDSTVGLIYSIKADTSDARSEVTKLSEYIDRESNSIENDGVDSFTKFGKSIGFSSEQMSKLSAALPIVGAIVTSTGVAFTAIAGTVVLTTKALFDLSKQTAATGTEIQRFSTLTGFTATTVSALKVAAEAAGTSIDEIEEVFESFVELMIEGGEGAEDAATKIKSLGLDPQTAFKDLEGSFLKVLDKIREMPTQAEKAKVAMDGMGESGLNMIKVAAEMEGGTAAYIAKLKEMGLTMDADGIRKAREFEQQSKQTEAQIQAIKNVIAFEFMPIFVDASKIISNWLKENRSELKRWATDTADFLRGAAAYWRQLNEIWAKSPENSRAAAIAAAEAGYATAYPVQYYIAKGLGFVGSTVTEKGRQERESQGTPEAITGSSTPFTANTNLVNPEKAKAEAEKRAKERQDYVTRDLAAQIQIYQNHLQEAENVFSSSFSSLKNLLSLDGDTKSFGKNFDKIYKQFVSETQSILPELARLETQQAQQQNKTENEKTVLFETQNQRRIAINEKSGNAILEKSKEIQKVGLENIKTANARELAEKEAAHRNIMARYEKDFTEGLMSEAAFIKNRQLLNISMLEFRKEQIAEEQLLVKKNSKEYLDYASQIKILDEDISTAKNIAVKESFEFVKKTVEKEKQLNLELLAIKQKVADEEIRLVDFRKEQDRKILANDVEISIGKRRLEAIEKLKQFDIFEASRKQNNLLKSLDDEEKAALERIKGKENEEEQKYQIEELYKNRRLISEEEFQAELTRIQREAKSNASSQTSESGVQQIGNEVANFFSGDNVDKLNLYKALGESLTFTFNALAQAVGNTVKSFVLFGTAGGSFRKFAAELLASIAQMAVVQAVWNLAEGFAKLALAYFGHPTAGASATAHFTAAGVYAGIAGIAAIAGRATAGNSFKQASSGSAVGGSTAGDNSSSSNGNRSVAGVFSSFGDTIKVIDQNRNQPEREFKHEFMIKLDSGGVLQVVKDSVRSNGDMRSVILEVVEEK